MARVMLFCAVRCAGSGRLVSSRVSSCRVFCEVVSCRAVLCCAVLCRAKLSWVCPGILVWLDVVRGGWCGEL
eukprot:10026847-Alexandrium_andersonii.AAC.1